MSPATLATVMARLAGAHADSKRQLAELTSLIELVARAGDDVGWVTRGSRQRRVRRALARYARSVKKLRDAQRALDEATELVGDYVSVVTGTLPVDEMATFQFLMSGNQQALARKVITGDWGDDADTPDVLHRGPTDPPCAPSP